LAPPDFGNTKDSHLDEVFCTRSGITHLIHSDQMMEGNFPKKGVQLDALDEVSKASKFNSESFLGYCFTCVVGNSWVGNARLY
jgi:hypothetical protein